MIITYKSYLTIIIILSCNYSNKYKHFSLTISVCKIIYNYRGSDWQLIFHDFIEDNRKCQIFRFEMLMLIIDWHKIESEYLRYFTLFFLEKLYLSIIRFRLSHWFIIN